MQGVFPSLPRILCLTSTSRCRLAGYILLSVTSRKVSPRASWWKLWDGTKLIRFAKSATSNIVLYSRSWQRQKGTILFALLFFGLGNRILVARAKTWCENRVYPGLLTVWVYIWELELNKTRVREMAVSPCTSPLGTFCQEERLRLSDRNSILLS